MILLSSSAPAASPVQGVPEGWQLAPKEPTLEQGEAGIAAMCADEDAHAAEKVRDTYKAMLAATPQAPSTVGEFMGIKIYADARLPADVAEFRDAHGNVLGTILIRATLDASREK